MYEYIIIFLNINIISYLPTFTHSKSTIRLLHNMPTIQFQFHSRSLMKYPAWTILN